MRQGMAVVGKTLFWARLRKDVGTRAALEWWLGSAATEEQIANWKKAHRALMPAHLIVQRLKAENMRPWAGKWRTAETVPCAVRAGTWPECCRIRRTGAKAGNCTAKSGRIMRTTFCACSLFRGYAASDGTGGNWTAAPGAGFILHGQNSAGTLGTRGGCRAASDCGALTEGQAGQLWKEEDCEYQPISAEEAAQYHWCPYRGTNLKTCDNACGKPHKCE